MKVETWIFGINAVFFLFVAPFYWYWTEDPTGTSALVMTFLLTTLVTFYLGFHARRMQEVRPEDNKTAEVADGAGELGFFPPYSWWPLWCAATLAVGVFGIAMGAWWMFMIAGGIGSVALCGWIFEYYRGEHAH
jgi:hypothetical protein